MTKSIGDYQDQQTMLRDIENVIEPFRSATQRKPVPKNSRKSSGAWQNPIDHLGVSRDVILNDSEMYSKVKHHVEWNIAHHEYALLKPCVAIIDGWKNRNIPYVLDIYGDGSKVKEGSLYVPPDEVLTRYLPLGARRRRDAIVSRIAISNISMLVPHVTVRELHVDEMTIRASYDIII